MFNGQLLVHNELEGICKEAAVA